MPLTRIPYRQECGRRNAVRMVAKVIFGLATMESMHSIQERSRVVITSRVVCKSYSCVLSHRKAVRGVWPVRRDVLLCSADAVLSPNISEHCHIAHDLTCISNR